MNTRVGYTGGTTIDPTYRNMGDHSETLQIKFNPSIITFEEIVDIFWKNHHPVSRDYGGRQYLSILFYGSDEQRVVIERKKKKWEEKLQMNIETEIKPLHLFFTAEDRHQKYYLKRWPSAINAITELYKAEKAIVDSTLAARLNGFVKGFGNLRDIKQEILEEWDLTPDERNNILSKIDSIRW